MKNTEKNEILTILKSVQENQEKMQEDQKEVRQIIGQIQENQEKMQEDQKEVRQIIGQIQENQEKMQENQEQMQQQINGMRTEIRQVSKSVAVIEHEHGQKLSALFDAFTLLSEKLETHENKINSHQAHLERHDDEIYYLKSRVQEV